MLYSVEQFPRCDLLRLSPKLGDSSCRLDEAPLITVVCDDCKRGAAVQEVNFLNLSLSLEIKQLDVAKARKTRVLPLRGEQ